MWEMQDVSRKNKLAATYKDGKNMNPDNAADDSLKYRQALFEVWWNYKDSC